MGTPLMAVPMHADSRGGISAGVPVALFRLRALGRSGSAPSSNVWQYAPSPDGQRFQMSLPAETAAPAIHVITNWLKATKDGGKVLTQAPAACAEHGASKSVGGTSPIGASKRRVQTRRWPTF